MYPIGPVLFSPFDATTTETESERFVPMISLHETPVAYEIEMALPTATIADVDVKPRRRAIAVRCRHAIDHVEGAPRPTYGTFVKLIRLGSAIDIERVTTELADGVLSIRAPKSAN